MFYNCGQCLKVSLTDNPFLKCGDCKLQHYCSKECQRKHWDVHKIICRKNIKTLSDFDNKFDKDFTRWVALRNAFIIVFLLEIFPNPRLDWGKRTLNFHIEYNVKERKFFVEKYDLMGVIDEELNFMRPANLNYPVAIVRFLVRFKETDMCNVKILRLKPYGWHPSCYFPGLNDFNLDELIFHLNQENKELKKFKDLIGHVGARGNFSTL
jgi:hypothetical protein